MLLLIWRKFSHHQLTLICTRTLTFLIHCHGCPCSYLKPSFPPVLLIPCLFTCSRIFVPWIPSLRPTSLFSLPSTRSFPSAYKYYNTIYLKIQTLSLAPLTPFISLPFNRKKKKTHISCLFLLSPSFLPFFSLLKPTPTRLLWHCEALEVSQGRLINSTHFLAWALYRLYLGPPHLEKQRSWPWRSNLLLASCQLLRGRDEPGMPG